MTSFERSVPVFPVVDVASASRHYEALGFDVTPYDEVYAFAVRDHVEIHLNHVPGFDPATSNSAVFVFVDDADALHAEWEASGVGGRLLAPTDAEYGIREGAHVDPDGNLVRFGSLLAEE